MYKLGREGVNITSSNVRFPLVGSRSCTPSAATSQKTVTSSIKPVPLSTVREADSAISPLSERRTYHNIGSKHTGRSVSVAIENDLATPAGNAGQPVLLLGSKYMQVFQ